MGFRWCLVGVSVGFRRFGEFWKVFTWICWLYWCYWVLVVLVGFGRFECFASLGHGLLC